LSTTAPGTVKNVVAAVLMLKSVVLPLPLSAIHQGSWDQRPVPGVDRVGPDRGGAGRLEQCCAGQRTATGQAPQRRRAPPMKPPQVFVD
jgi:hypothetical protein